MLELFICLILELLELHLKFYSLWVTFFLWNLWSQIFGNFFLFTFFKNLHLFSIFIKTRIAKLKKIESKKTMLVGDQGGNPII
jgi:hypothetical protein